jgi:lysophospholipase L1-like esterase
VPPSRSRASSRSRSAGGLSANLALALAALAASLGIAEAACQLYARLVVFPAWDRQMALPNFFLARSDDPVLAYELKPDLVVDEEERHLRINRYGVRADTDDLFEGRRKLALLGDSVTMGAGLSQEKTLDRLLEARLRAAGDDTVVLNFGVPGYASRELVRFLERKDEIYHVDRVLYLMNPNDFARRDSIYEGADNGLYRMFVRPGWQTLWFARKGVYRVMKGGPVSLRWYRWMFGGNEARTQADLRAMAAYCAGRGIPFSVVILPSGLAYGPDGYQLDEMNQRLLAFFDEIGVEGAAPMAAFADDPKRYLDDTDHFHDAGNERMAEVMQELLTGSPTGRVTRSPTP